MPRALLLLLKANDCLRSIDAVLGRPLNTIAITARACSRASMEGDSAATRGQPGGTQAAHSGHGSGDKRRSPSRCAPQLTFRKCIPTHASGAPHSEYPIMRP